MGMQLPKYKKKKRIKLKKCQEPGCGREFWGHPIAKYCELHRDIKARAKTKSAVESVEAKNLVFRHNYTDPVDVRFRCSLENCEELFPVKIFPKQFIYPRFCMEHRNDFKRENYVRLLRQQKLAAEEAAAAAEAEAKAA
jgi:hypothetical protein